MCESRSAGASSRSSLERGVARSIHWRRLRVKCPCDASYFELAILSIGPIPQLRNLRVNYPVAPHLLVDCGTTLGKCQAQLWILSLEDMMTKLGRSPDRFNPE